MDFSVTMELLGVLGLIATFSAMVFMIKRKSGIALGPLLLLGIVFCGSTFLCVFGDKIKVISSISSGAADDK